MPPNKVRTSNELNSRFAQKNRAFIEARQIEALAQVGALNPIEHEVADRVDGVIDNLPANGVLHVDELLTMEQPSHYETLFPTDEQPAIPRLWALLEWETTKLAKPASALPAFEAENTSTFGDVDTSFGFPIANLPADLVRTAQRVQLVLNGDLNAGTISVDDTVNAKATGGRFKQSDLDDVEKIRVYIMERLPVSLHASAEVPKPGIETIAIPTPGTELKLAIQAETSITERRHVNFYPGTDFNGVESEVGAKRMDRLTIDVAAGEHVILVNPGTGEERVFPEGKHLVEADGGLYRAERWRNGDRLEAADVELPKLRDQHLDLTQYSDHQLTAGGQPLTRTPTSATYQRDARHDALVVFEYTAPGQKPSVGVVDDTAVDAVKTPQLLPEGRYQFAVEHYGNSRLYVFPEGATVFEFNDGRKSNLLIEAGYSEPTLGLPRGYAPDRDKVHLSGNRLSIRGPNGYGSSHGGDVVIDASQRF